MGGGMGGMGGMCGWGGKGMMMPMSMMNMMMGGMGKGGGWGGGSQWEYTNYKVDKSGGELGQFKGTIKSFSDKTGYGFIESEDVKAAGHGDVFLHGAMKKGYRTGNIVKFTCVLNKDGKPAAIDLKSGLKD